MFTLMGANGNITSKAARSLLADRKKVRVVGRDAARLQPLKDAGAELAIGDAADAGFLTGAFKGAEAVYTMIPPSYVESDMRGYQNRVGEAMAVAVSQSGVKRIVNLSSVGGGLPTCTGPIAGLHDQEERLNRLTGVAIVHLRPAYFFENHLMSIGAIKTMGVYPGMIRPDVPMHQIATKDIAAAVARELAGSGTGRTVKHLLGPKALTLIESAAILGRAIGKPDLKYVQAPAADAKKAMRSMGLSQNVADGFEEMCGAFNDGRIAATITRTPESTTPTPLEEFAGQFAAVYRQ